MWLPHCTIFFLLSSPPPPFRECGKTSGQEFCLQSAGNWWAYIVAWISMASSYVCRKGNNFQAKGCWEKYFFYTILILLSSSISSTWSSSQPLDHCIQVPAQCRAGSTWQFSQGDTKSLMCTRSFSSDRLLFITFCLGDSTAYIKRCMYENPLLLKKVKKDCIQYADLNKPSKSIAIHVSSSVFGNPSANACNLPMASDDRIALPLLQDRNRHWFPSPTRECYFAPLCYSLKSSLTLPPTPSLPPARNKIQEAGKACSAISILLADLLQYKSIYQCLSD